MERWNPKDGDLYLNMIEKIHQTGGKYAGILWYQGCSDTNPEPASQYLEHFRAYAEAVRAELGCEIPIFTMQLNRQINGINDECWGIVRDAQANVALGEKLAKQCAQVLNGEEEYQPPKLIQAERADEEEQKSFQLEGSGIWLKLTFAHVKNCFLVYSALGKDSGFTLTDRQGEVEILHIRGNRENKNHLYLELAREAEDEAELSFAWQADPVKQPPIIDLSIIIVEVLCIF